MLSVDIITSSTRLPPTRLRTSLTLKLESGTWTWNK